ncbi:hypothetical protein DFP72DRAFT_1073634 [Ephemerocybe angulata]|uniref:Uncharacterized protein n=1 Tax=Ephemerocybe angulata TaxID=980116 RepID=A0A8H6LZV0_9AGAR|nr:hypothetical protein DFP72DRAFT_1073634 [Tulosesus angulatus]
MWNDTPSNSPQVPEDQGFGFGMQEFDEYAAMLQYLDVDSLVGGPVISEPLCQPVVSLSLTNVEVQALFGLLQLQPDLDSFNPPLTTVFSKVFQCVASLSGAPISAITSHSAIFSSYHHDGFPAVRPIPLEPNNSESESQWYSCHSQSPGPSTALPAQWRIISPVEEAGIPTNSSLSSNGQRTDTPVQDLDSTRLPQAPKQKRGHATTRDEGTTRRPSKKARLGGPSSGNDADTRGSKSKIATHRVLRRDNGTRQRTGMGPEGLCTLTRMRAPDKSGLAATQKASSLDESRNDVQEGSSMMSVSNHRYYLEHGGEATAEEQPLDRSTLQLLGALSAMAHNTLHCEAQPELKLVTNVHWILRELCADSDTVREPAPASIEGSLCNRTSIQVPGEARGYLSAIRRIETAQKSQGIAELAYYLGVIEFALEVNLDISKRRVTENAILTEIHALGGLGDNTPSLSTLRRYLSDGTRACALASAGSMYLVIILACCRIKDDIKHISGDSIMRLARMIARPPPATESSLVGIIIRRDLIPAISYLRVRYPIRLAQLLPLECLLKLGATWTTECGDILHTDRMFLDFGLYNDFIKTRDEDAWARAIAPRSACEEWSPSQDPHVRAGIWERLFHHGPPIPPQPTAGATSPGVAVAEGLGHNVATSTEEATQVPVSSQSEWTKACSPKPIRIITTNYDPELTGNKEVKHSTTDGVERYEETLQQREHTKKAVIPRSIEEFETLVRTNLDSGERTQESDYVELDMKHLDGRTLRIDDKNGDWLFIALPDMPDSIREPVLELMELLFPGLIRELDTNSEGIDQQFESLHFSFYNRYAQHAHEDTPMNADVGTIRKVGKCKANSCCNVPRGSREYKEYPEERDAIYEAFEPLFEWISYKVQEVLPEDCEITGGYVDVLPGKQAVACYPFPCLVLNFNVAMRIHRDVGDDNFCITVGFSEGSGGELCLQEPGIKCHSRPGDVFAFRSSRISHFNMDYVGKRISMYGVRLMGSQKVIDHAVATIRNVRLPLLRPKAHGTTYTLPSSSKKSNWLLSEGRSSLGG